MSEPAIVLANARYLTPDGKTAHGLVRMTSRYLIRAVIDPDCAGRDAGELLDGVIRDIPVVADLAEAIALGSPLPTTCVVGVATLGGRLETGLREQILVAVRAGLNIVNGLHEFVSDDPEIANEAAIRGVGLRDIRKPRPSAQLHFWSGAVRSVGTPRIAVLGTDCGLGKRTTAQLLTDAANAVGIRTEMIYTGQTGWMQGGRYGFILDSVANDFVCGELEHAIVECEREARPDLMIIEGQSALRNPSGPCGAELLLAGGARGVVLQHAPARTHFEGFEASGIEIPTLESEVALIGHYQAETIAVCLNGEGLPPGSMEETQRKLGAALGVPVVDPLSEGVECLLPAIRRFMAREGN